MSDDPMKKNRMPKKIGRYMIEGELGRGAFGIVYKGIHSETQAIAAIKSISIRKCSKEQIQGVLTEISVLKQLKSTFVVRYIGHKKTKKRLYIYIEFVENGSLKDLITKRGPLPEEDCADFTYQVLKALEYVHKEGVIHRDIKGANILLTNDNIVKLADFGVASDFQDADTNPAGTPYWMAPEVIEFKYPNPASDIWSVGALCVELLTGTPPYFNLPTFTALYRIVQEKSAPIPTEIPLTDRCRKFLLECFERDVKKRKRARELLRHPWFHKIRKRERRKRREQREREQNNEKEDEEEKKKSRRSVRYLLKKSWRMDINNSDPSITPGNPEGVEEDIHEVDGKERESEEEALENAPPVEEGDRSLKKETIVIEEKRKKKKKSKRMKKKHNRGEDDDDDDDEKKKGTYVEIEEKSSSPSKTRDDSEGQKEHEYDEEERKRRKKARKKEKKRKKREKRRLEKERRRKELEEEEEEEGAEKNNNKVSSPRPSPIKVKKEDDNNLLGVFDRRLPDITPLTPPEEKSPLNFQQEEENEDLNIDLSDEEEDDEELKKHNKEYSTVGIDDIELENKNLSDNSFKSDDYDEEEEERKNLVSDSSDEDRDDLNISTLKHEITTAEETEETEGENDSDDDDSDDSDEYVNNEPRIKKIDSSVQDQLALAKQVQIMSIFSDIDADDEEDIFRGYEKFFELYNDPEYFEMFEHVGGIEFLIPFLEHTKKEYVVNSLQYLKKMLGFFMMKQDRFEDGDGRTISEDKMIELVNSLKRLIINDYEVRADAFEMFNQLAHNKESRKTIFKEDGIQFTLRLMEQLKFYFGGMDILVHFITDKKIRKKAAKSLSKKKNAKRFCEILEDIPTEEFISLLELIFKILKSSKKVCKRLSNSPLFMSVIRNAFLKSRHDPFRRFVQLKIIRMTFKYSNHPKWFVLEMFPLVQQAYMSQKGMVKRDSKKIMRSFIQQMKC